MAENYVQKGENGAIMKKGRRKKLLSGLLALVTAGCLATTMIPADRVVAAEKTTNIDGFSAVINVDPTTSDDNHIFNGTPAEDGKIWTDKTVTTGASYGLNVGEEHFGVTLSAMAQTYNTITTSMTTEQEKIAYDVVFVLDGSGSMTSNYVSTGNGQRITRAQAMINALNPALVTLMENENNRFAIVKYNGASVDSSNATTLMALDHYHTTSTNSSGAKIYFEHNTNYGYRASLADGVTKGQNADVADFTISWSDGTPTQRGIYRGMNLLQQAEKPNDDVTRIPIMVLLTDGAAGSANTDYRTLDGNRNYYGNANSNGSSSNNDEVGYYTVLTANYAKRTLDALYRGRYDYTGIIGANDAVAKFYTIGLGITANTWTHYMLNPVTSSAAYDNTAKNMQSMLTGTTSPYQTDYNYVMNNGKAGYYGGENISEEELKAAFADIIANMQVESNVTNVVNNPLVNKVEGSINTSAEVIFTDYLGYKMELKGQHPYLRYKGVNYRFDVANQTDTSMEYRFSGYDQDGNSTLGPIITENGNTYDLSDVIFKADKIDETYNGQTGYWKITFSFPSPLLPAYSRTDDYDQANLEPIRMLYEVGLEEGADLHGDSLKITADGKMVTASTDVVDKLIFHSNLYEYGTDGSMATGSAKTYVQYKPALENPFYYKTGYTTDKSLAGTEEMYIRVDVETLSEAAEKIQATTSVRLENISVSKDTARATFTYNGQTYTVDLTGDRSDGETWVGEQAITVTGTSEGAEEITANAAVRVEALYDVTTTGSGWNRVTIETLTLSEVSINGTAATLSNNNTVATFNNLIIHGLSQDNVVEESETVSVYMKIEPKLVEGTNTQVKDAAGNPVYVATDARNNKIDVIYKQIDGKYYYVIALGENTYYSTAYYKYAANANSPLNYENKHLDKGTTARSLLGHLIINQDGTFDANNFSTMFQYQASTGIVYPATAVVQRETNDSVVWGTPGSADALPPTGTFKVCIDGIKNGQYNIGGVEMKVHFDFIIEAQKVSETETRYVVIDCSYWEAENSDYHYAVDMNLSTVPEIRINGSNQQIHTYDVSYTIETEHVDLGSDKTGNKTQTADYFFQSWFNAGSLATDPDNIDGTVTAYLGNNGRLAVDINDAYDNQVTVNKKWISSLGTELDTSLAMFNDIEVEVGLYRQYSYVDAEGTRITHEGIVGTPFKTVVLNQANDFSYTWEALTLPGYVVTDNGDIVYDKDGNKVPVTYTAGEMNVISGWMVAGDAEVVIDDENHVDTITLTNVPLAEFTPTLIKTWTKDGKPVAAPAGYQVRVELLANGQTIENAIKLDKEHVITAALTQKAAGEDAVLTVTYGNVALGSIDVKHSDFQTANTFKTYTFEYAGKGGAGIGGEVGSGTHADDVEIDIILSNTNGDMLAFSDAMVTYDFTVPATGAKESVTLHTYRSNLVTEGSTKTATFLMQYRSGEAAIVILDGIVDADGEHAAWQSVLNKWNLPMLQKNEATGEYEAVVYSIRETLIVPDSSEASGFKEYTPDATTGLITVGDRVFKSTTTIEGQYHFTLNNDESETSITATKVWVDNDNKYNTRPASITLDLYNGTTKIAGQTKTVQPDEDGAWIATWEKLPVYDAATGNKMNYVIKEGMEDLPTSDTYDTAIEVDGEEERKFTVTNTLYGDPAINDTFVQVEKNWIDDSNAENIRPQALYMVLYRVVDGVGTDAQGNITTDTTKWELVNYIALSETDDTWNGEWTGLAKYNTEGKKYVYFVKEYATLVAAADAVSGTEGVPGYTSMEAAPETVTNPVTNDTGWKYTFINQLEDGTISKTVTKVWKDAALANERPADITVVLSYNTYRADANGNIIATLVSEEQTLNAANSWTHTWDDLPVYSYGKKVDYTISETKVGTVNVAEETIAGTSNTQLAADFNGYKYVVTTQDDGEGNNFTVTNTLTGETEVAVYKEWNWNAHPDKNDGNFATQISSLKEDVKFNIYSRYSGYVTSLEIKKDADPASASVKLPKYNADGSWILYTITEEPLTDGTDHVFTSEIGTNTATAGNFAYTATNTYVPLYRTINGSKTWFGVKGDNIPEAVGLVLKRYIEGADKSTAVEVAVGGSSQPVLVWNKNTNTANTYNRDEYWTYTYENLPVYEENDLNKPYVYFVEESTITLAGQTTATPVAQTDYTAVVSGFDIINELLATVDGADLDGEKEWVNVSEDALANLSIRVELWRQINGGTPERALTANGQLVDAITVDKDDADTSNASVWKFDFAGNTLPKYDINGNPYTYLVKEVSMTSDMTTSNVAYESGADYAVSGSVGDYTVTLNGLNITNSRNGESVDFPVTKEWDINLGNNVTPNYDFEPITVNLKQNGTAITYTVPNADASKVTVTGTDIVINKAAATSNTTWEYTFVNLSKYAEDGITENVYSITEIKVGNNDIANQSYYVVSHPTNDTIINAHGVNYKELTVTKVWAGVANEDRPDSVEVQLYRIVGGTTKDLGQPVKLSGANDWQHTFTHLPLSNGTDTYAYAVREVSVTAGSTTLEVEYEGDAYISGTVGDYEVAIATEETTDEYKTTITNTLKPEEQRLKNATYPLTKIWGKVDFNIVQDPSIKVELLRDGKQIVYAIPSGDTVMKMDTADPLGRNLIFKDGTASSTWNYTFTGLRYYSDNGIETAEYLVRELAVLNFDVQALVGPSGNYLKAGDYFVRYTQHDQDGTTVNNLLAGEADKEKTNFTVTKEWNIPSGTVLPESITVRLLQNGGVVQDHVVITAANQIDADTWAYSFENLPKYKADGVTPHVYTVEELKVGNVKVDANNKAGAYTVSYNADRNVITNAIEHSTETTTSITVNKEWAGAATSQRVAEAGTTITLQLLQNGVKYPDDAKGIVRLDSNSGSGNWSYTFDNLPKYSEDGTTLNTYTVVETAISVIYEGSTVTELVEYTSTSEGRAGDYLVTITTDNHGHVIITNELKGTPDKPKTTTNFIVTKEWIAPSGTVLPDKITVGLISDNDQVQEVELTATNKVDADTWTYTFTGIPVYRQDGISRYVYTVNESEVGDTAIGSDNKAGAYTVAIINDSLNYAATITNSTTPDDGKTIVTVAKKWKQISADNLMNTVVAVQLLRNGTVVDVAYLASNAQDVVVTDKGLTWTYTFKDLPKYSISNTEYEYTVKEFSVNGTLTEDKTDNGSTITAAGDFVVESQEDTTESNKFIITNTLTGTVSEFAGKKVWADVAKVSERPGSVTIGLYRTTDGSTYELVEKQAVAGTQADTEWSFVFNNNVNGYDKYNKATGDLYTYVVKELKPGVFQDAAEEGERITLGNNEYRVSYGMDGTTYTVKNTLYDEYDPDPDNPLETPNPIKVTKVWQDDNNSQGKRPESIHVTLKRGNTILEQLVLIGERENVSGNGSVSGNDSVSGNGSVSGNHSVSGNTLLNIVGNRIMSIVWNTVSGNLTISGNDVVDRNTWARAFAGTYPMYDDNGALIVYEVVEDSITDYVLKSTTGNAADGFTLTNVYAPGQMSITIDKVWVDDHNALNLRPNDKLVLELMQNGAKFQDVILSASADDTWTVYVSVPVADENGKLYVYTVNEPVTNADYISSVNGYEVTNTLNGTVDVKGEKHWEKIDEAYRPASVTVELYSKIGNNNRIPVLGADRNIMTITTTAAENWKYDFGTLPKYDENGALYTYIVEETMIGQTPIAQSDYEVSAVNGYDLTNALKNETQTAVTISGSKIWLDNNDEYKIRPDAITVNLLQDGVKIRSEAVSADVNGEWKYVFSQLPKYNMDNGKPYTYTVEEEPVINYISQVKENNIINTIDESKIQNLTLSKIWVDGNNAQGKRPAEITLNLLQNNVLYRQVTLRASGTDIWTATVKVPSADKNGNAYTYTVEEPKEAIEGTDYAVSVDGYTVTNTLTGSEHVVGYKKWADNIEVQYLPESVTVELWRSTEGSEATPVTAADGRVMSFTTYLGVNWKYDFGELPKYDENGALYTYVIKETMIGNTAIADSDYEVVERDGYNLTNAIRESTKTAVTVKGTKTWEDFNDQYNMRPQSITVNLLRDGVKIDSVKVEEAADGTWTYEFKGLAKYDMNNGKLYTYSVEEEAVADYISEVNGFDISNKLDETKIPEEPEATEEPEEPEETPAPSEPTDSTVPLTGDNSPIALYLVLLLAVVAGLVGLLIWRKKKEQQDN